jgi:flagellar hook-basal body complex protein FliE
MSAPTAIISIASNLGGIAQGLPSSSKGIDGSAPFGKLFSDAVGDINTLEGEARTAVDGLITGSGVDVHQAIIATQKAEMGFELALSLRNKAMQAYQSVMGMQF